MSTATTILLAIFLPALAALPVALAGRRWQGRVGWLALVFPVVSFLLVAGLAWGPTQPAREVVWPWVPALGLDLVFRLDGLSLFFALIVSGMGVLVFFYARHYLAEHYEHQGRFYAALLLFMAAMLGTVLAGDLLLLFIFWELTGIASFLLIGFLHGEEGSRRGARMALLVTGVTGLAGLAGIVVLRQIAGTLRIGDLLARPELATEPGMGAALVLLMIAAFGKSAQVPFHFWLPNAMSAPTPVSAYLHSATMVKLGVFLAARLFPVFQAHPWWPTLVATVAFTTLAVAAVMALLSNELKAILAYSTVSQLGFLLGYYGLGPAGGVEYDYLHILNHVFYKGALFMVVGIVYVSTHATDIRDLGGLWRRSPALGLITAVACASMLGFPGTTGFLSKELMFKEIFVSPQAHGALGLLAVVSVVLSSLVKVAFSLRLFVGLFLGRETDQVREHWHAPSMALLLPPALLAGAALVFGVAPELLVAPMHHLNVPGLHTPTPPELHLWHGWTRELAASVAVVAGGAGVVWIGQATAWRWTVIPTALRADRAFDFLVDHLSGFSKGVTRAAGSFTPHAWLRVMMAFIVGLVGWWLLRSTGRAEFLPEDGLAVEEQTWDLLRIVVAGLIALGAAGVVLLRTWPAQLLSLSVAGFLTTLYFVLYHAPDLALTQILVETVSLVLIALLLARFPLSAQEGEEADRRWTGRQVVAAVLAAGFGAVMTALGWMMTARPHPEPIGPWFTANTKPLAEGLNAVNTLLVDFRGFDTLGEITVLVIAMLGCLGLLFRRTHATTSMPALAGTGVGAPGQKLSSPAFAVTARVLFFLLNVLALYLLLRGHNAPGGGFIGGLVTATSMVVLSLALGWRAMEQAFRFDPARMAFWGLVLAGGTALAPVAFGRPFLEHFMAHVHLPVLGEVHVGTPLLFDLGVYLVVVGITMKMVTVLGRSTEGAGAFIGDETSRYSAAGEEAIEPAWQEDRQEGAPGAEKETGHAG